MKKTGKFQLFSNVWRVAGLLLVLVLFTSHFSLNIAARFVSKGAGGNGGEVAKFSFVITSDLTAPAVDLAVENIKPGDRFAYGVEIKNQSEVAVRCTVQAKNISGNLPLVLNTVSKDLRVNQTQTLTFFVEWPESENSSDFMGLVDWLEFSVKVEQMD